MSPPYTNQSGPSRGRRCKFCRTRIPANVVVLGIESRSRRCMSSEGDGEVNVSRRSASFGGFRMEVKVKVRGVVVVVLRGEMSDSQ